MRAALLQLMGGGWAVVGLGWAVALLHCVNRSNRCWAGLGWAGLGWAGWAVGPVAGPGDAQYCSTVQVVPRVLGWVYWVLLSAPHTSHHCRVQTPRPSAEMGGEMGGP